MKIGFVCGDFSEIEVAARLGFDGIEVCFHSMVPGWMDPSTSTDEEVLAMKKRLDDAGIKALSTQYGKPLVGIFGMNEEACLKELTRSLEMTKMLGSDRFTLNCYIDPAASVEEQETYIKNVYTKLGEIAAKDGLYIAIENCPHDGRNYVYSPATMKRFKELVPNENVGFEFDPSHLVWLGCDYIQALREVKDYVFAVHAKDTQVMEQILQEVGIMGKGWWRYRLPGWGQVNWKDLFTELLQNKYDGPVIIEHEDPVFDGPLRAKGLKMGLDYLKPIVG